MVPSAPTLRTSMDGLPHPGGVYVTVAVPSAAAATDCSSNPGSVYRYSATPGRLGWNVNTVGWSTTPLPAGVQVTTGPDQTENVLSVAGERVPSARSA